MLFLEDSSEAESIPQNFLRLDRRWDSSAPDQQRRLYADFDALVMRRDGWFCLRCNEALTSGLPVIMSNTSPNDSILPAEWLVPGAFDGGFTSRVSNPIRQRPR